MIEELEKIFKELDCAEELAAGNWTPFSEDNKGVIKAFLGRLLHCSEIEDPEGCGKKGWGKKIFDISRGRFLCIRKDLISLFKALMEEAKDINNQISPTRLIEMAIDSVTISINDHSLNPEPLDHLACALIAGNAIQEMNRTAELPGVPATLLETLWKRLYPQFSTMLKHENPVFPKLLSGLLHNELTSFIQVELFLQMFCLQALWEPVNGREWHQLSVVLSDHEMPVGVIQLKTSEAQLYIPVDIQFEGIIPRITKILDGYADEESIKRWNEVITESCRVICEFPLIKNAGPTTQAWKDRKFIGSDYSVLFSELNTGLNSRHIALKGYCYALLLRYYSCDPSEKLLEILIANFPQIYSKSPDATTKNRLMVLFKELIVSVYPKCKLSFPNQSSIIDIAQALMLSFHKPGHGLYATMVKMWEKNQMQLSSGEYVEAASRVARAFLSEYFPTVLGLWATIQPMWRNVDQSLFIAIIECIVRKNIQEQRAISEEIRGLANIALPEKVDGFLINALEKLLGILSTLELFPEGYALVQDPNFSLSVRAKFIGQYEAFLTSKGGDKALWLRLELAQKHNLDKSHLFDDFSRYFHALGKKVSKEQINALLNSTLNGLQVDSTDLIYQITLNKINLGQLLEASQQLVLAIGKVPTTPLWQNLFIRIFKEVIKKRDSKSLRGIANGIGKNPAPFWDPFLWKFFSEYLFPFGGKLSKNDWEFITSAIQRLLVPQQDLSREGNQYKLVSELCSIAQKLLPKTELRLSPLLSFIWTIILKQKDTPISTPEHYLMLNKELLGSAYVYQFQSGTLTDEIRRIYRPILTEFLAVTDKYFDLKNTIGLFHYLYLWFGSTGDELLEHAPFIVRALKAEAHLPSALLQTIHTVYADKYKGLNAPVETDHWKCVERLFLSCFDMKLYAQSLHWFRYILAHAPKTYSIAPQTVDQLFEILRRSVNDSSLSYEANAVDIKDFIGKHPSAKAAAKSKWIEQSYVLKSMKKYDLCVQTLLYEIETFGEPEVIEIEQILKECVLHWNKLKKPRSTINKLVQLVQNYPLKGVVELLAFFRLFSYLEKSDRNSIYLMLKKAEADDFFKGQPYPRKECWTIALKCMKDKEEIFALFEPGSLFHQAFPKTSDPLVLSDMYLALMRSALRKLPFVRNERANQVLYSVITFFDDIKELCKDYGLKLYPYHSSLSFWNIWMYKDLSADWEKADETLRALLENSRQAASIIARNVKVGHFARFYEIRVNVLMIEVARSIHMHVKKEKTEVDDILITRFIQSYESMRATPKPFYFKFHPTAAMFLQRLMTLPLNPQQKLLLAEELVKHMKRSSDMVRQAQRMLREVMYVCLSDPKKYRHEALQFKKIVTEIFNHPMPCRDILAAPTMERILMQLSMYNCALGIERDQVKAWQDKIDCCSTLHRYRMLMQETPLFEKMLVVLWTKFFGPAK
ncbi:MAG: hypothetical protein WC222_11940 [Parachlamydiales bacterium]